MRSQLADLQRARIIGAAYEVCRELGAGSVSVAHIVARSGVSRRTFYEQFTDREDCLLVGFEQALAVAGDRVTAAYDAHKGWRERMRAGLVAFLTFLDEEPAMGRMLVVESLAAGPRVLRRRAETVSVLTRVVDEARTEVKLEAVSPLTAEGVIGGVLSVIQSRLAEKTGISLLALTNPLMNMIVLPYLGTAAARRELDRPVELPTSGSVRNGTPAVVEPFKEMGMRLTYRTVRVLLAIWDQPETSNRLIGESAGVHDQGQISKLLGRLERIGLIENTGIHPGKGAPNSWQLTDRGRRIADGVRAHTTSLEHQGGEG